MEYNDDFIECGETNNANNANNSPSHYRTGNGQSAYANLSYTAQTSMLDLNAAAVAAATAAAAAAQQQQQQQQQSSGAIHLYGTAPENGPDTFYTSLTSHGGSLALLGSVTTSTISPSTQSPTSANNSPSHQLSSTNRSRSSKGVQSLNNQTNESKVYYHTATHQYDPWSNNGAPLVANSSSPSSNMDNAIKKENTPPPAPSESSDQQQQQQHIMVFNRLLSQGTNSSSNSSASTPTDPSGQSFQTLNAYQVENSSNGADK
ncbi:hypothetical protein BLOT_001010 [Blomia tropicalis]|nr:hypothetical protein BLOT_001010 [Blomia tropicalis]